MTRKLSGKARIEIVRGAMEVATNNESNVSTMEDASDVRLMVMYIILIVFIVLIVFLSLFLPSDDIGKLRCI